MMASKGWKVVQAHIPMIKFRKGGNRATGVTAATSTGSGPTTHLSSKGATGPNVTVLPTIEDYQIPARFQRRPIDEKEIAYINRGGPE
ncbi:28S ribosomal protein S36, mitochondrial [Chelonus insularis]|uniref:28S ribosomal protein S36, mitochondrial n=1 Tax=Chelonus insularis TaxID=460826 RepID=UPI00158F524D|nr:28S ribosomal protein S36, mitochondrial [Chelonus insularis]